MTKLFPLRTGRFQSTGLGSKSVSLNRQALYKTRAITHFDLENPLFSYIFRRTTIYLDLFCQLFIIFDYLKITLKYAFYKISNIQNYCKRGFFSRGVNFRDFHNFLSNVKKTTRENLDVVRINRKKIKNQIPKMSEKKKTQN